MKRFSSIRFAFLIVLFLGLFALAVRNVTDPDLWWHLKTGQLIVETHSIPHTDPFSYTRAGHPWITHEWLSEIVIYEMWRIAEWVGLILTFAAILCAAFFILFLRCRSNIYLAGMVTLCGAFATRPLWGPRPQVISLLLASLWLFILERSERRPNLLWWTLPILLLWANLHAGFTLGLVFSALFLTGNWLENKFDFFRAFVAAHFPSSGIVSSRKPLLFSTGAGISNSAREPNSGGEQNLGLGFAGLILALDLLTVPVNPNGTKLFFYPLETLRSAAMQSYIGEWASPNFHRPEYWPFLLLILATFAVAAWSPSSFRARDLLLLVVTFFASLRSIRLIPFFVLIATPLIAEAAEHWPISRPLSVFPTPHKTVGRWPTFFHAAIMIFMAAFVIFHVRRVMNGQPVIEMQTSPVRAVAFLKGHPPSGAMFNAYDWGGYLIWELFPPTQVFVDGRADLYGDSFLHQFADTHHLKGNWRETLQRWNIQTVLIPSDSALASGLRESRDWRTVYDDGQAIIFSR